MIRPVLAATRSILTFVIVSLYVLIVGPPGILLAVLFGWQRHLYVLGHIGVRIGLAIAGIRYKLVSAQPLPIDRPAVYCANHQSNIDPPLLFAALHPQIRIMYKAEINKIPILALGFRIGGFLAIDRRNKEAALRAIDKGAESIRGGHSFLIFPEGTRSRTDDLLPFKKGGFIMAIKAQAPIVPVAIHGGREAMRRGSRVIHPVTISVRVGTPIETTGMNVDERDDLITTTRAAMETLLREAAASR
jgi:1-acyl-sn-glycerol-3-phosphate acyltransferase